MAYEDFLVEFAKAQGVGSVEELLSNYAKKYSFQIKSRERAKGMISTLADAASIDFRGKKVLDVGCAYGSYSIELSHRGANVVGIDLSQKWLDLAVANSKNEVSIEFLKLDASTVAARRALEKHAPFDFFVVNDVFEHIFDTAGVLQNISRLSSENAQIYLKIPNGYATRSVLSEGHKKVFGISLLAPDYWPEYVKYPFHIYYRRWEYFDALFRHFGFNKFQNLAPNHDRDIDHTREFITSDLALIRQKLVRDNFSSDRAFVWARNACELYFEQVEEDLETLSWQDLHSKYRLTFWDGIASKGADQPSRENTRSARRPGWPLPWRSKR